MRRVRRTSTALLMGALVAAVVLGAVLMAPGNGRSAGARAGHGGAFTMTASRLPSKRQWLSDVRRAMRGSKAYVQAKHAQHPHHRYAINFDIDNTTLETKYDPGHAVPVVRSFADYAHKLGIKLVWNTGRTGAMLRKARRQLTHAGYTVTEVCGRHKGEGLLHSKQRCRRHFKREGYILLANVGNRSTDFAGIHNYMRAFRLPNYGGRLG